MSAWWRIAYKGSRLTLGLISLLILLSHAFMFLVYIAVSGYVGEHAWAAAAASLVHLSACCILVVMLAALLSGRYGLARILALAVLALDIVTIVPGLLRLILLSLLNRWLGLAGGVAAPAILFILVYLIDDLEAAARGLEPARGLSKAIFPGEIPGLPFSGGSGSDKFSHKHIYPKVREDGGDILPELRGEGRGEGRGERVGGVRGGLLR